MKNEIQRGERIEQNGLGVFEETAPLKKVLMWGAPGTEAVLGQLLPKSISCFESEFNVLGARAEFENAKNILESQGVEVISVKDLLATFFKNEGIKPTIKLDDLSNELKERGIKYHDHYGNRGTSEIGVLDWVDTILTEDAEKYGEEMAIAINRVLSLGQKFPLANILYARDQSNLIGDTLVWSSMRYEIRQPEVELFKMILNSSGIFENSGVLQTQVENGKFEGGDGIASGGIYYIGVGGRSNLEGIMGAAPTILRNGGRLMIPFDEKRNAGGKNEMDAMHLDTIWMPCGVNQVVGCIEEIKQRKLLEVVVDKETGNPTTIDKGWFADHLEEKDMEFIPLTKDEQKQYAPNFLNLGNGKIVLSLAKGNNLTQELAKRGKKVYNANLLNITKGYGGLHCMTAAIKRG